MTTLNAEARETLAAYEIPVAEWVRAYGGTDGKWHGDVCGCPDDRCVGYHHDEGDDCDLRYWIEGYILAGRAHRRQPFGRALTHA